MIKLIQLFKEVTDLQVSIDTSTKYRGRKMKALEQKFEKERNENINYFESNEAKNKDLKDKLGTLEDTSQRDNLGFVGIAEHDNESWSVTEEHLKDFLYGWMYKE